MRRLGLAAVLLVMISFVVVWGTYNNSDRFIEPLGGTANDRQPSPVETIPASQRVIADWIVIGAREEVKNGTRYDASYQAISYPGGDVSPDRGACTDVVIRALRRAGIDLQQLIHEDMTSNFAIYPQKWDLSEPDSNIDHRRVPNQMTFFQRHGQSLTCQVEGHLNEWKWGDIVYWRFDNGEEHCGIISDLKSKYGRPLVIHNAGIAVEEDCLERWEIIGHYRYPF
ncbi:MAG TPA: DUF1287 domain-containing protein [Syntrophomonadaceae bacterium]|nr:DUF1287 domain-containing protein [Syntrophomonadaceae bacterium]HQA06857.1 DUF1287 domain-containing protein [Syntrophomonadaceae bacterium]HQE22841.1 DUF1287 domain-containing protein [Syntrophomonadaceae bacterium]